MKICFFNIFGELKNAEQETLMRLKYCFEKQGHMLIISDRYGFINEGKYKGKHIEDLDIDFLFTYNTFEFALAIVPDIFSVFLHWSPIGFVANFQTILELKAFNQYDYFGGFYETNIIKNYLNINPGEISPIASSVPEDFSIKPQRKAKKKLFYVGINFERKLVAMRYETLFKELDKSNLIDIYGPKEVYGQKNLWAGFSSYRGEIPFDGKSILKSINEAGICLALNSPMHNDANAVSNRLFEAAAAGAVIISDDNKYVRDKFGDSVFYINPNDEKKSAKQILEIINWIEKNPNNAYEMACKSQNVFLKDLGLNRMTEDFIYKTKLRIYELNNINSQTDVIDIICYIDSIDDYTNISRQLNKQYYQNFHLLLVTDKPTYEKIQKNIKYSNTFIEKDHEFKGKNLHECFSKMKGNFFTFMDGFCIMHKRHIHKNLETIKSTNCYFCYSGCYIKDKSSNKYIVINNREILRDEFLSFKNIDNINWEYKDMQCLFIETIFSRNCCIFRKDIMKYVDFEEASRISNAIHYYIACCLLIKTNSLGRFTYALTAGYHGSDINDVNNTVFHHRKFWHDNRRSAKLFINEFNLVFFKYTFETLPNFIPYRNLLGENVFYNEEDPQQKILSRNEKRILKYIKKSKISRSILNLVLFDRNIRKIDGHMKYIFFLKKHHFIRNIFHQLSKKIEI